MNDVPAAARTRITGSPTSWPAAGDAAAAAAPSRPEPGGAGTALPAADALQAGALSLTGYGVAFGERVILADVSFELPGAGVTVLMGPTGTGKSTLLRSLAGLNAHNPRFRTWGRAELAGALVTATHAPRLVQQNAKVLNSRLIDYLGAELRDRCSLSPLQLRQRVEEHLLRLGLEQLASHGECRLIELPAVRQRLAALAAASLPSPSVLMVDEPTTGLGDFDAWDVQELLQRIGQQTSVLVVLHNQAQARRIGRTVLLLAGGRLQADLPAADFFDRPPNGVASQFVRTGSCAVPAPDAKREDLAEDVAPPPALPLAAQLATSAQSEYLGPRGFQWVIPGKVAGTPQPGVVANLDYDLAALRTVGVTMLITLTEGDLPQDALRRHGLRNLHLPIKDREPPTVAQAKMLTVHMDRMIQRGEVLAVHCLAGLGRTGTILASWLIYDGLTAAEALARIRKINPAFVQSRMQEQFLVDVEADLLRRIV